MCGARIGCIVKTQGINGCCNEIASKTESITFAQVASEAALDTHYLMK
jgi:hypothetical protein